MTTKYVLNSGGMNNNPDGARRYFAELVKDLGDKPKILLCHFAQPREVWEQKFSSYAANFTQNMPSGVKPEFTMGMPNNFTEQVGSSDVIYFHGGDDHLALFWLTKLKIGSVCAGKVVGTNSATTHALSKSFWTCDWRQCFDGLGVLPIKTIAHFGSTYGADDPRGPIDWEKAKKDLEDYGDTSLPIHALPEGEFIVIEQ